MQANLAGQPKKPLLTSGRLIAFVGLCLAVSTDLVLVFATVSAPPNTRAVMLMGSGLVVLWALVGGTLMRWFREPVQVFLQSIRLDWRLKFVLFATGLALMEEVITTAMTNLAPLFGVPVGAAYITASTNYLDVVLLHSVVVFVPMFIAWAFLLSRYDFSPNAVFLLFGVTGMVGEAIFGGPQAFLEFGLWIFVYGLMVYLPAYSLPARRGASQPKWWHYILAVLAPILFAIPVAIVVSSLHPVSIHFPPIQPNT